MSEINRTLHTPKYRIVYNDFCRAGFVRAYSKFVIRSIHEHYQTLLQPLIFTPKWEMGESVFRLSHIQQ